MEYEKLNNLWNEYQVAKVEHEKSDYESDNWLITLSKMWDARTELFDYLSKNIYKNLKFNLWMTREQWREIELIQDRRMFPDLYKEFEKIAYLSLVALSPKYL